MPLYQGMSINWHGRGRRTVKSLCASERIPENTDMGCAGGQAAVRQGQLRMMPPAGADVSCIAFTTGTAAYAVMHWLLELRAKGGQERLRRRRQPQP